MIIFDLQKFIIKKGAFVVKTKTIVMVLSSLRQVESKHLKWAHSFLRQQIHIWGDIDYIVM